MDELTKLRQKLAAKAEELKAHRAKLDECESDEDRKAWRNVWDSKKAEYEEAKKTVKVEEDRLAELEDIDSQLESINQYASNAGVAGGADGGNGQTTTARSNPNVTRQHENIEDDPNRGFRDHREFLTAVFRAGSRTGNFDDRRLALCYSRPQPQWQGQQQQPRATAGSDEQGVYSDPYGGFLVPEGFLPDLLTRAAEGDPTSGLVRRLPMQVPTLHIPARVDSNHTSSVSGGLQVYRRAETDSVSATRVEFEQVVLQATSLFGVAYATEEILEFSPMSFVALLEDGFGDEFAAKMLNEKIRGTGAGQFEGVLNSPAAISVAKEDGQAADTIVKQNIDKMRARCWGYNRAVWLYNHDCLPELMSLVINVGTGGSVVNYFNVDASNNATLLGRPAFATEFASTIGDNGDLILCNWSQFLFGELVGMRQAESIHVRFLNHERTFKFWTMNDGRCWWRAALTPDQSSDTLSPIVTLAARA